MSYTPTPGDQIVLRGRPSTEATVIATDPQTGTMWIRPQGASKPLSIPITDQWQQVVAHPTLASLWHAVSTTAISRGFAARAAVIANLPADTVALMHVKPDATVDFEWLPVGGGT